MKDPKALFPFLFASSWLGNLFLTILAFYLAFTHDGPLSPLTLFSVALCILAGNLLPITAYLLFIRFRQAELLAEAAEASIRVRDALRRSEEVMGRLDEAEGALSKAILIARQVPDRIAGKFEALEALTEKLNTLQVDSFTETLQEQGVSLEALQKEAGTIQSAIKELKEGLDALPKSMSKAIKDAFPTPSKAEADEMDVSVDERLDLVFESLEGVQDSLDGLLQRMAELNQGKTPEAVVEEPPDENEPPVEEVEEEEEEAESVAPIPGQEEMTLEADPIPSRKSDANTNKRKVQLNVQAMVGISNKLYIRGDEPWLSWDNGQLMNLIGIGEFAWEMDDLKESIDVTVLLNDEIESEVGRITLEPGKPQRVNLKFPRR